MSSVDAPYVGLPPPVNDLTVTARAPAAALSRPDGQIHATGMDGLFVSDVRVLTEARVRFGGIEPHPLAAQHEGPGRTRFIAVARNFGDQINDPTVRVDRIRTVLPDGMTEEIRIASTALRAVRAWLTVDLRCDLTPLEAAKAGRTRPDLAATASADALLWTSPDLSVRAAGSGAVAEAGAESHAAQLRWPVALAPGDEVVLTWRAIVDERDPILTAPAGPVEWQRPTVRAADARLARLLARSLDDLESLRLTDTMGSGTFLGAGAPWFLTLFGRDSLWAARMLLPLGTTLAEGTLRTLARRQGSIVDDVSGEAPGKIMHELRHHDARLGRGIQLPGGALPATYYGTVDATLLWISLLADAWRWGLPDTAVRSLLPHLHRALSWLDGYADPNRDGFVEYLDATGRGLANQGWKDSFNAIRFHDGRLATAPIALCEVQGYAHRAALDAADLLDALDPHPGAADRWRAYAGGLAERFRARFWVDGPLGAFPALALDGDGRPVDSLTSNIGHLLGTGLLSVDEERRVAELLATEALAGGYGLRTMSTLDSAYAPLSYHCGSVWPHDTAIAVLGLARAGADPAARGLIDGLLTAAEAFDHRLPELYGGDARTDAAMPIPYPAACRPQAWAAAASVAILQACLGLSVDTPQGTVKVRPLAGVGALDISGLCVGGATVDVSVDADGGVRMSGLPPALRLVGEAMPPAAADGAAHR